MQRFGTQREQEYGPVTAIDISLTDTTLICGYGSGNIVLWSIQKNERIKTIKPIEMCPILTLKFWKDTKQYFIASTATGSVYMYKMDLVLLKWSVDIKPLPINEFVRKRNPSNLGYDAGLKLPEGYFSVQILQKEYIRGHALQGSTLIALASLTKVVIITVDPFNLVYIYKRPNHVAKLIPSISWGKGAIPGNIIEITSLIY